MFLLMFCQAYSTSSYNLLLPNQPSMAVCLLTKTLVLMVTKGLCSLTFILVAGCKLDSYFIID